MSTTNPSRGSYLSPTTRYWGDLYVIGIERGKGYSVIWKCLCSCGKICKPYANHVVRGNTRTCGHGVMSAATKHGLTSKGQRSPEMDAWWNMISRCTNPSNPAYKRYGGRGIGVCQSWMDSFGNFWVDMGFRPEGMTLERIDNSKGYSPENCRWATRRDQANNRDCNRVISARGKTMTIAYWCRETGINRNTLNKRLRLGWEPERAIFHPIFQPERSET